MRMHFTKKTLRSFLIFPLILLNSAFSGQFNDFTFPMKSQGDLAFYADLLQYAEPGDTTRCELYYSLNLGKIFQNSLIDQKKSKLKIELNILDKNGIQIETRSESKIISLSEKEISQGQFTYLDVLQFKLKPDTFDIYFSLKDSVSGREGSIDSKIPVKSLNHQFSLSDVSFISKIIKSDQQSNFQKNGLLMIPTPSRIFYPDAQNSRGYVYYEINNLSYYPEKPTSYGCFYRIEDLRGKTVAGDTLAATLAKSENLSRVEVIPVSKLPSGAYKLTVGVRDIETNTEKIAMRYFWIDAGEDTTGTVLPMSDADIQKYYDQIKYIANHQELQTFKQLDAAGKQKFLLKFWKSKDPTPATPENEFMEEHFRRIAFCEKNFKGGINSDRGRVYIQYGPPLEVSRQASPIATSKSSEIWTYSINGTTEFVFVDRTGDGNYVLVHSTHPDEIENPEWEDEVNRAIPKSNKPYQDQF
jgi:GWxTD domain-containing protein